MRDLKVRISPSEPIFPRGVIGNTADSGSVILDSSSSEEAILKIEYVQCASSPIGLEAGDSKSLGGTHSACQFDPDLAH